MRESSGIPETLSMPWRLAVALVMALVSNLLLAQAPATNPPAPLASLREPQLLPSQKGFMALGKCQRKSTEWARVLLDIDEGGSPQRVELNEASRPSVKDLATDIVHEDRFAPAEKGGKPVAAHAEILVEMVVCTAKAKSPDGKKEEQAQLETEPRQTLYLPPVPPPEGPGVQRVGGHISAPVALIIPSAEYTDEARTEGIQGEVMVTVIVDAQGMPQNPRIVRPMPAGLNEAALNAVRKYRFKPAMKDGKTPVPVMVTIAVNFRL
jgi:TonB family protein